MSTNKLTIKVPGKLMVAGEFAVLIPHHHLAVTAVDRFVYATIEDAEQRTLTLEDYQLEDLSWGYKNGKVTIQSADNRLSFVKEAMEVTCTYLAEAGVEMDHFNLAVRSELDDASGVKYGLGSSAAVVTAVVTAIMARFTKEELDKDVIFKLAALAHVNIQGSGSGADVAASVYGGILQYSSFQAEWLLDASKSAASIHELLEADWIYLSIKRLTLPASVSFCVGWTGNPASTTKLVGRILKLQDDNPQAFKEFLAKSERAVHTLLTGMEEENQELLFNGVKANRKALATVGNNADVSIETALLGTLCDLADGLGGAGKPSGAGGGDCGIAFMPSKRQAEQLFSSWEKAGIKPLSITSHPEGATVIESKKNIKKT